MQISFHESPNCVALEKKLSFFEKKLAYKVATIGITAIISHCNKANETN